MSHESATDQFNDVVREMGWGERMRRAFHDHLQDHYDDVKNQLSFRELLELAQEFEENYY